MKWQYRLCIQSFDWVVDMTLWAIVGSLLVMAPARYNTKRTQFGNYIDWRLHHMISSSQMWSLVLLHLILRNTRSLVISLFIFLEQITTLVNILVYDANI